MTALTDYPPDDDPRTHTLHGVAPMPLSLPDLDTCTEGEFYDFCRAAMHSREVRDRMSSSDRHRWTTVNKVLALAHENAELQDQIADLQAQVQAYRDQAKAYHAAYEREAAAAIEHAGRAQDLLQLNERRCQDATRARDCVRAMAHQLATVLTELSAKDQELELLRGFDRASRSIAGAPAAVLGERLVPEPHSDPFGPPDETRVWLARGTDPANETVVVDEPWGAP